MPARNLAVSLLTIFLITLAGCAQTGSRGTPTCRGAALPSHLPNHDACCTCLACEKQPTAGASLGFPAGILRPWHESVARVRERRWADAIAKNCCPGTAERMGELTRQVDDETVAFVILTEDFVEGTDQLTAVGRERVLEIACQMRYRPLPVIIQCTKADQDLGLDCLRSQLVTQLLADLGHCDADIRVVWARKPESSSGGSEVDLALQDRLPSNSGLW